jgi:hypothetical protein
VSCVCADAADDADADVAFSELKELDSGCKLSEGQYRDVAAVMAEGGGALLWLAVRDRERLGKVTSVRVGEGAPIRVHDGVGLWKVISARGGEGASLRAHDIEVGAAGGRVIALDLSWKIPASSAHLPGRRAVFGGVVAERQTREGLSSIALPVIKPLIALNSFDSSS